MATSNKMISAHAGTGNGAPDPPFVYSARCGRGGRRRGRLLDSFLARSEEDDLPPSLRAYSRGQRTRRADSALYSNNHLARTYPASAIGNIKVNGEIGMDEEIDQAAWCLDLAPMGTPARTLTIADIRALPRFQETIDFKCVEGWSTVTQFAGARLSDFTAKFAPGSEKAAYVGMRTPGKDYYVGVDDAQRAAPADSALGV